MKRYILPLFLALIASVAAMAGNKGALLKFDSTNFDLGTIHADKGVVKATYTFTNDGDEPLVIINVSNGGCGCTKPAYPMQPILPGKSGEIVINFNPSGRRGELNREVKVKSNAKKGGKQTLRFSGVIIP